MRTWVPASSGIQPGQLDTEAVVGGVSVTDVDWLMATLALAPDETKAPSWMRLTATASRVSSSSSSPRA